jgi:trehalose-6-phosphatase
MAITGGGTGRLLIAANRLPVTARLHDGAVDLIDAAVVAHRDHAMPGITVAIGDDRTDEDLFRALPKGSITIAVGRALTAAHYVVPSHRFVRRLLRGMVSDAAAAAVPLATGESAA